MPSVDNPKTAPRSRFDPKDTSAPAHFLPFGQPGFATNTNKRKKKLEDRAHLRRYLRAPNSKIYQVFDPRKKTVTTVRPIEFQPTTLDLTQPAAAAAVAIDLKAPRSLTEARSRADSQQWKSAYTKELRQHDTVLRTWRYELRRPEDRPVPFIVGFKAKLNQFGGLDKRKVRIAIRGDRMHPGVDFDATPTAAHMPTMAARRLLLAAAVANKHAVQTWDVPGAYMRAPIDPRFRQTMQQPPEFDGDLPAPGKICVMQKSFNGAPDANYGWESFSNYWVKQWGWTQVASEPSMFWIETNEGVVRMERSTDDFCVTGASHDILDKVSYPFRKNWQVTIKKLSDCNPIHCNFAEMRVTHQPVDTQAEKYEEPVTTTLQHVGLMISRLTCGGIKMSNPKGIDALLATHGLDTANAAVMPYTVTADMTATKPDEPLAEVKAYQELQ